jgi:hypothetical protein
MGNICSSAEPKAKKGKSQNSKQKKRKASAKAESTPKNVKGPSKKGKKGTPAPAEQHHANPLLLKDDSSQLSSIASSEKTGLHNKSSADLPKAAPQQPKDFEQLTEAKLSLIRGWIDASDKKELLDPQDVAGYQRRMSRQSSSSNSGPMRIRRASILESVAHAEIAQELVAANGSLRVEKTHSSGEGENSLDPSSGPPVVMSPR